MVLTKFKVIGGLRYPIILIKDWWCWNHPVVIIAKKQITFTLRDVSHVAYLQISEFIIESLTNHQY